MRAALLSRQPWWGRECTGLCTSLWMNCANTQDGGAMPGGMPGEPPAGPAGQLPAQMRGDWMGCGEDPEGIATVPAPDGYPHVTSGWGSQASARCSCRGRLATDGSHWLVLPSREVPGRSGPDLLGYRAGAGDAGRGQNKANNDLSGLAGRGVAPLVAERADEVQSAASPVEGAGPLPCPSGLARVGDRAQHAGPGLQQAEPDRRPRPGIAGPRQGMPSRIGHKLRHHDRVVWAALCMPHRCRMATAKSLAARTDPGSAPSARLAIRGRHAQRARAGSGDGQLLRPRPAISAAGISQCRIPGMTGALPSPPGRCHRASRTGVCTFPDRQILAVLTVPARCRLAAAASSPGPGRIQDHAEGMEVPTGCSAYLPAGTGLIGREIGVPFRLRPAGRGVAAGSAARVTAASQRGAAGGAVAGHGGDRDGAGEGHVPVPHRDRAGGPEPGIALLAPGAGQPAEGVDAPAGIDRAGAGVGFAERCRIGIPGDARAHLAPHDRHPQLITDHSPRRGPGRASGRGRGGVPGRDSGRGRGGGPGRDSAGSGPGWGSGRGGRGRGDGPGEGFWPGTAGSWPGADMAGRHGVAGAGRHGADMAARLGVARAWHAIAIAIAIAGRHGVARATGARANGLGLARAGGLGTFAVPKLGEPVVHLKHAGVLWPDLGLHVGPPVELVVSRAGAGDLPWGRSRRPAAARPDSRAPVAGAAGCGPLPLRVPLPVQSGRAYRVRVRSSHHLGLESQPDKHAVNVRPIYELSRRGVWTIPISSARTGRGSCSPS